MAKSAVKTQEQDIAKTDLLLPQEIVSIAQRYGCEVTQDDTSYIVKKISNGATICFAKSVPITHATTIIAGLK